MKTKLPFISVIVPCRNEEAYIKNLVKDIYKQDYPTELMEVFIIDGESEDETANIVKSLTGDYTNLYFLTNLRKIVPTALNIGIKAAKGDIIIRLDAHCEYPINYFSYLVENLIERNADNVGVAMIAYPRNESLIAKTIAKAISCPFGIGDSYHRTGLKKAIEIDSVPFGCYKKEVFEKYGLFDEELIRNQDDEFNSRIVSNGGKIWLLPDLEIKYFARDSFYKIFKMFYYYGFFKPLVNKKVGRAATIRQFVPPLFVLGLIISFLTLLFSIEYGLTFFTLIITPYLLLNFYYSFKLSLKEKNFWMFFLFIFCFLGIHISYGVAYLKGFFRFRILSKGVGFQDLSTNR